MLIDCDTCTVRGTGCGDCVVTVLLGAPPGWEGVDPVVVQMTGRSRPAGPSPAAEDVVLPPHGVVVEFEGEAPGVDLGDEEEVADDALEAVGVSLDDAEELPLLVGQVLAVLGEGVGQGV